jgi:thiol:disulfide interchange protein
MPAAESPAAGPRSTRSLPNWLLAAAVVLLGARLAAGWLETRSTAPVHDLVAWQSIDAAESESHRTGKPILYDFSAEWCGPCRVMEREVFSDPKAAEQLQQRFVPVKVVDRQREDGRNPPDIGALQARYHVQAFPTLVVAYADGRELERVEGYIGRQALMARLGLSAVKMSVKPKVR